MRGLGCAVLACPKPAGQLGVASTTIVHVAGCELGFCDGHEFVAERIAGLLAGVPIGQEPIEARDFDHVNALLEAGCDRDIVLPPQAPCVWGLRFIPGGKR